MPGDDAPDVQTVLADPNFHSLPLNEKNKVLLKIDPNFAALPAQEQSKALYAIHYGAPSVPPPPEGGTGFWSGAWQGAKYLGQQALSPVLHPLQTLGNAAELASGAALPRMAYEGYQQYKQARQSGSPVGSSLVEAAAQPVTPVPLADVRARAQRGDVAGVIGEGIPAIATTVLGGELGARPGVRRPIETIRGGPVAAGTEDVFMAAQPGAGAKDFALRDNIETAKGDLAEIQRKTPIEGRGGVINPDMRVRSFVKNTNAYLDDLWKRQVMPQVRRWSQAQVSLQPLKQSMLEAVSGIQTEFSPAAARQVQSWISRMPETETLGQLMTRRQQVNAMLKTFEAKGPQEQAAMLKQKPMIDALKAQDKAIDNAVMQELTNRGEPGIQDISRRYAAISDIRDAIQNQMNSAEAFRMYRQVGLYLNPRSWFSAHERIPMGTSRPGPLLEKGLGRLERGGVQPPANQVTEGPAPMPSPARMLPAPGGTGGGGYDPTLGTQAPGGPSTELPPRVGYPAANPADRGEALARVEGRSYQQPPSTAVRTPPLGYSSPGTVEGTGIERSLAAKLKSGDVSRADIMEMAKRGEIAYDAPRRIFRAAQRGIKAPPPETAKQFTNRKNQ